MWSEVIFKLDCHMRGPPLRNMIDGITLLIPSDSLIPTDSANDSSIPTDSETYSLIFLPIP